MIVPEHAPTPVVSRAVYGFFLFLLTKSMFCFYLLWIYTPQPILEYYLGLPYLPKKYFALFSPILVLLVFWFFCFCLYPLFGLVLTPNCDKKNTIQDIIVSRKTLNGVKSKSENQKFHNHFFNNNAKQGSCDCPSTLDCLNMTKQDLNSLNYKKSISLASDLDLNEVCLKIYYEHKQ